MADEKRAVDDGPTSNGITMSDVTDSLPAYTAPPTSHPASPSPALSSSPSPSSRPLSVPNSLHLSELPTPPHDGLSRPSATTTASPKRTTPTGSKRASADHSSPASHAQAQHGPVSSFAPSSLDEPSHSSSHPEADEPLGVSPLVAALGPSTQPAVLPTGNPTPNEADLDEAEAIVNALPTDHYPTIAFAIPLPETPDTEVAKKNTLKNRIPPFILYAPLKAPLKKYEAAKEGIVVDGEGAGGSAAKDKKEGLMRKAQRKWQEEEKEAREKPGGWKSKGINLISKGMSATKNSRIEFLVRQPNKKKLKELKIVYPASYSAEQILELFQELIKAAKSGAIKSGLIATAIFPFVAVADLITPVPGPAEINAVWAVSSWTGAYRASSIASGITNGQLPVSFVPSEPLNDVSRRLHEICWQKAPRPGIVKKPERLAGTQGPKVKVGDVVRSEVQEEESGKREGVIVQGGLSESPRGSLEVGEGTSGAGAVRQSAEGKRPVPPPPGKVGKDAEGVATRVYVPKRGPQLAELILDEVKRQGGDVSEYEANKTLLAEDLGRQLEKGAKEWLKMVC